MKKNLTCSSLHDQSPESLFKEYFGRLSYFAFQFVKDKAIAEDFAQDAFASYWDRKDLISNHPQAIKDFLYTTIRYSCLNYIKRQKVQERYFLLNNDPIVEEKEVLEKMIEAEVAASLHKAVATLPESCRRVFILSYFENLSNLKIAEVLNISINTVRCHKQNGLKALRTQLNMESFLALLLFFVK